MPIVRMRLRPVRAASEVAQLSADLAAVQGQLGILVGALGISFAFVQIQSKRGTVEELDAARAQLVSAQQQVSQLERDVARVEAEKKNLEFTKKRLDEAGKEIFKLERALELKASAHRGGPLLHSADSILLLSSSRPCRRFAVPLQNHCRIENNVSKQLYFLMQTIFCNPLSEAC